MDSSKLVYYYSSAIGKLELKASSKGLSELNFVSPKGQESDKTSISTAKLPTDSSPPAQILKEATRLLDLYFSGANPDFSQLPLDAAGTDFQLVVWHKLKNIAYGQTVSYKEMAKICGHPQATRAIGGAMRTNPIAIIQPCHRVVGRDGSLVGFASGIEVKKKLLALEGKNFSPQDKLVPNQS